jgi:hypothetical protein
MIEVEKKVNDLMKPIIYGALIVAIGVFLGVLRIAYVVSFEGKLDSCVKTLNDNATRKTMGWPSSADAPDLAKQICINKMLSTGY